MTGEKKDQGYCHCASCTALREVHEQRDLAEQRLAEALLREATLREVIADIYKALRVITNPPGNVTP